MVELVELLQQADIDVSLIFLLGAGGQQLAELHLSETIKLLRQMNLRPQDRVYLSDLLVHSGSEYRPAQSPGWPDLFESLGVSPAVAAVA